MSQSQSVKRINTWIGSILFLLGTGFALLMIGQHWLRIQMPLPAIWYQTRSAHLLICVSCFICGVIAHLKGQTPQNQAALFQTVRVYTKPECSLCNQAIAVLDEFSSVMPEIEEVDISHDSELTRLHARHVPVVEIDGRIRFRGIVSSELLDRLIRARKRKSEQSDG